MLFQSSIVKVTEFILFDPEKLFTSVLPRLTLLPYSNYAEAILSFSLKRNYHKSLIETSKVVLTFAALFPTESAVSGFKVNNIPKLMPATLMDNRELKQDDVV